jgi:Cu(I)/Ag(I) efflux system membrane fusion protein
MRKQHIVLILTLAFIAAGIGAWRALRDARPGTATEQVVAEVERKPLYWYDPMRPEVRFDKPGKSPFMDMELVAKYPEANSGDVVTIDPRMVQNLGIRTATVVRGAFAQDLKAVGTVSADERRLYAVESRAGGWVERLMVRAAGDPVARGAALAGVYAPDLLAAQEEFLLASRSSDATLAEAARARLSLLGMTEAEIDLVASSGKARRQVTLVAPVAGVVVELNAREGMQVASGVPLFRIADLSKVWILVEVPEAQAAALRTGRSAEARLAALPGETFKGRVDYIYPELQATTRTVRARLAFDNPGLRLKPGMHAEVSVSGGTQRDALLVPSEAVIRTGTRSVVILADGEGRFRPAAVVIGGESDGATEILDGLEEGESIVVSGQFLIDSEANLRSVLGRLAPHHDGGGTP